MADFPSRLDLMLGAKSLEKGTSKMAQPLTFCIFLYRVNMDTYVET